MEKIKVVSAKAMSSIEGIAYARGYQELDFMESAGASIAQITEQFVHARHLKKTAILLVGKGNNGGDAYVAGRRLIEKGFYVKALHVYQIAECGALCKEQKEKFERVGGHVEILHEGSSIVLGEEGIILDGLVGTGFKGKAEGVLAEVITKANSSDLPILAIDIPSGLCGNTGTVGSIAIEATATIYLELPKIGFFLGKGLDYVGELIKGEFGFPSSFIEEVTPDAFLVQRPGSLPKLCKTRNKYDAGYVLAIAGSSAMIGAGLLSSYAALRSGAGMVRWFYPEDAGDVVGSAPWEIIKEPLIDEHQVLKELDRAKSVIVGPGIGRKKEAFKIMQKLLPRIEKPCVIDADALFYLANHPSKNLPKHSILTPHTGELRRLLEGHCLQKLNFFEGCQAFVEKKKVALLVKGAPNFFFEPGSPPHILSVGNPGMATAGSGDVLSGVLAALLAQGLSVSEAAILGCFLHGKAGDFAAMEKTPFCMTACDILHNLPKAFFCYLEKNGRE